MRLVYKQSIHSCRFLSTKKTVDAIVLSACPKSLKVEDPFHVLSASSLDHVQRIVGNLNLDPKKRSTKILYDIPEVPLLGLIPLGEAQVTRATASQIVQDLLHQNQDKQLKVTFGCNHHIQALAEGATLGSFQFSKKNLKFSSRKNENQIEVTIPSHKMSTKERDLFNQGVMIASAQNLARSLSETPANFMTPTHFCDVAKQLFKDSKNVQVNVFDSHWIEQNGMGAFYSVTKGSDEPCRFLELIFMNDSDHPKTMHALVGKGVTFDAGGISIKPSTDMALMKGDMAGAANVLAAFHAATQLNLKLNLVATIPLTENLINGKATKPGDVVIAMNGKSIEVDNTDAEGRLILADAIHYTSKTYRPMTLVEMSTLTGAMDIALGYGYAGVFTKNQFLFRKLFVAGIESDDLMWQMPFSEHYINQIQSQVADLKNVGGRSAGSCTAAAFLQQFLYHPKDAFAHVDIAGVFYKKGQKDYLANGMTGRPTRALIYYLQGLQNQQKEYRGIDLESKDVMNLLE